VYSMSGAEMVNFVKDVMDLVGLVLLLLGRGGTFASCIVYSMSMGVLLQAEHLGCWARAIGLSSEAVP
jgi:hypothetical protein